jgi:hypothetical protein
LTIPCSRAFSSAIAACETNHSGELARVVGRPAAGRVDEQPQRVAVVVGAEREHERRARRAAAAGAYDFLLAAQQARLGRARGLHRRLCDHGQERFGVVRRRKRVAHEGQRLAHVPSIELDACASRRTPTAVPPDRDRGGRGEQRQDRHDRCDEHALSAPVGRRVDRVERRRRDEPRVGTVSEQLDGRRTHRRAGRCSVGRARAREDWPRRWRARRDPADAARPTVRASPRGSSRAAARRAPRRPSRRGRPA